MHRRQGPSGSCGLQQTRSLGDQLVRPGCRVKDVRIHAVIHGAICAATGDTPITGALSWSLDTRARTAVSGLCWHERINGIGRHSLPARAFGAVSCLRSVARSAFLAGPRSQALCRVPCNVTPHDDVTAIVYRRTVGLNSLRLTRLAGVA